MTTRTKANGVALAALGRRGFRLCKLGGPGWHPKAALRALLLIATLLAASSAEAQYRYVDKDGIVHWVGSELQIPPEYRGQVAAPRPASVRPSQGGMSDDCFRSWRALDEMASEQWQRYGRASDPMAVARKLLELRPECAP